MNTMKYRKIPSISKEISALGFGCMRFPLTEEKEIDEQQCIAMLDYAIDQGVNYFDTAWGYHNEQSQVFLGTYLKAKQHSKPLYVATKLPCWLIKSRDDMEAVFQQQLERLQIDCIDFYLLHSLNGAEWDRLKELGIVDFLNNLKRDGKISHIGFSFHDDYQAFETIINEFSWEFCQIQFNYFDTEHQAGLKGLKLAAEKGMGVIVMEPLRGGKLVGPFPTDVDELFSKAKSERSYAGWALDYVWDFPECSLVLSGMSTMEQTVENCTLAATSKEHSLSSSDLSLLEKAREMIKDKEKIPCTSCGYCTPCPSNVGIIRSFEIYNNAHMFGPIEKYRKQYFNLPEKLASNCTECGHCEEICPQKIPIINDLRKVHQFFE